MPIIKPENVHVVSIASPVYFREKQPYAFGLETVKFYTKLHGYPYHVVNPVDVLKVYGIIKPDAYGAEIICSKSLIMLCK